MLFVDSSMKQADVVFLLDESGSICGPHFKKLIKFVKDVVVQFEIGQGKTRVGALTFGSDSRIIFNLDW